MHHEFQTDDFAQSFVGVWRRITTEPRRFFQDMPVSGGIQNPLLFAAICLAVGGIGFLLIGPRGKALPFVLGSIVRSFVYAALFLVIARQVFSGVGNYEATYRVVAYSMAPFVLYWIPVVGKLALLYSFFLVFVGLERVHGFDAVRSVLTLILSALVIGGVAWAFGLHYGLLAASATRAC